MISFVNAMKLIPARALDTKCRISRSEFWWDNLAMVLAFIFVLILTVIFPLFAILFLPLVVFLVFITIRRLHDLDMSGWWALTLIFTLCGFDIAAGFGLVPGMVGPNRFGPDPHAPGVLESLLNKSGTNFQGTHTYNNAKAQGYAQQPQAPQGFNAQPAAPAPAPVAPAQAPVPAAPEQSAPQTAASSAPADAAEKQQPEK